VCCNRLVDRTSGLSKFQRASAASKNWEPGLKLKRKMPKMSVVRKDTKISQCGERHFWIVQHHHRLDSPAWAVAFLRSFCQLKLSGYCFFRFVWIVTMQIQKLFRAMIKFNRFCLRDRIKHLPCVWSIVFTITHHKGSLYYMYELVVFDYRSLVGHSQQSLLLKYYQLSIITQQSDI
jgi:hypothetical protein